MEGQTFTSLENALNLSFDCMLSIKTNAWLAVSILPSAQWEFS